VAGAEGEAEVVEPAVADVRAGPSVVSPNDVQAAAPSRTTGRRAAEPTARSDLTTHRPRGARGR
jgi:hypothetical protein